MNGHTFPIEAGADIVSLQGQAILRIEAESFAKAVEDDKDMKQVSYDCCFMRDQPGMESAKILVSEDRAARMVSAHVVPSKGLVIDGVIQQCARDLERFVRGTSDRGCVEGDRESSWVAWNVVGVFAGCRLTVERVH